MLKQRLTIGVPLSLIAGLAFCWPGLFGAVLFMAFALVFTIMGVTEFFGMTDRMGYGGYPKMTTAFGVAMALTVVSTSGSGVFSMLVSHELESVLIVLFLIFGFLRVFRSGLERQHLVSLLVSVGGLIYVCWTLNAITKLYFSAGFEPGGRYLAFFLIAVTKMGDVGAFAVGTASAKRRGGNHKMAPGLSPKKSWEGFFGGLAASVITALLLVTFWGPKFVFSDLQIQVLGWRSALAFGIIFAVVGCWGDLAESALKRAAGVKDSGRLPGFGGALDMLDSLMLVAPLFYAYAHIYAVW